MAKMPTFEEKVKIRTLDGDRLNKYLEKVSEIMGALGDMACDDKLHILAIAAGIHIEHILDAHLQPGEETPEGMRPIITKAFATDLGEAMKKARQLIPALFEEPESVQFPEMPTLSGVKPNIVH